MQSGQAIHGADADDLFGISASLSSAGDTVVIGGNKHDSGGFDSGHALVYMLAPEWVRVGQELVGEATGGNFGRSVAISDHGTRIAVGVRMEMTEMDLALDTCGCLTYSNIDV